MPRSEPDRSGSGRRARFRDRLWWLPFGRVAEVSAAELARQLAREPPQLLDVRSVGEWQQSHIAGAISVPINQLPRRLAELALDPGRPVVAICMTAHRSVPAVRLLRAHGFVDVAQLAGGMLAWWKAGLPTVARDDA
jgi:rhodanese-related sulfurtransferase